MGNPAIRAGEIVNVKGVGDRFSGRYRITRAVHRYDDSGYATEFEASGRRTNTLGELLAGKNGRSRNAVIGIVTNNRDPDGLGRVKVSFPTLPGNEESAWARLVSPMAGDQRGMLFIPETGQLTIIIQDPSRIERFAGPLSKFIQNFRVCTTQVAKPAPPAMNTCRSRPVYIK